MNKKEKINKVCPCGNGFTVLPYRAETAKYCSYDCLHKYKTVAPNSGQFKQGEVEHLRRREIVPIICGIYKITNPNSEVYIGGSRTIYRRWLRHREARKNIPIHRSIKKYGWRDHSFEIAHVLPSDVDDKTLLKYEQIYIDAYKGCGVSMLNVKEAGSAGKKMK